MTNRKDWKLGCSASFSGSFTQSVFEEYAKNRVDCIEMSFRSAYYDEIDWKSIPTWSRDTGVEFWSIHLPFGRTFENISYIDEAESDRSVQRHLDLIGRAGEAGAKTVVIHPSSEPIPDSNRSLLLNRCIENLSKLCARAKQFGMQVAVEDLPRTCLGNCSEEILKMLGAVPELRACFDTNHLLKDSNVNFVRSVSEKIITLHVSDYDFIDEKHVFPGDGLIDWNELMLELELVNYSGPFMYEVKSYENHMSLSNVRENFDWLMSL